MREISKEKFTDSDKRAVGSAIMQSGSATVMHGCRVVPVPNANDCVRRRQIGRTLKYKKDTPFRPRTSVVQLIRASNPNLAVVGWKFVKAFEAKMQILLLLTKESNITVSDTEFLAW